MIVLIISVISVYILIGVIFWIIGSIKEVKHFKHLSFKYKAKIFLDTFSIVWIWGILGAMVAWDFYKIRKFRKNHGTLKTNK